MTGIVKVICKLPHGLIIEHPKTGAKVTLNGKNKDVAISPVIPILFQEMYGSTDVDADFWEAWLAENKDFAPIKNNAIFASKDSVTAKAKVKELAKEKTGFEGMPQNGLGIKKDED
jgi:hypothetical protein